MDYLDKVKEEEKIAMQKAMKEISNSLEDTREYLKIHNDLTEERKKFVQQFTMNQLQNMIKDMDCLSLDNFEKEFYDFTLKAIEEVKEIFK